MTGFCNSVDQWIGYLDAYTLQQLQQRPAPDSWSLGQVYQHLISDTRFYTEQMEAAMATDEHADCAMTPEAAALFAVNSFPNKPLANPFNDIHLQQPESKEQLRRQLTGIREKVCQLFKNASIRKGKTLHPGFQYFNAAEWLQFADMHLRHHLWQKEKIDKAILQA
ncbi:DinB family protein [Niabella ginsenosidivorans]|uniref:DinB family protein n=1 Tax=Niabella ginsenosidivorans TaxID=1176587 RepID=UPI001470D4A8|nr:DinB family protein [Niabella ginsenosidivorans]